MVIPALTALLGGPVIESRHDLAPILAACLCDHFQKNIVFAPLPDSSALRRLYILLEICPSFQILFLLVWHLFGQDLQLVIGG